MKIVRKYFFLFLFPIILVLPLPLIFGSIGLAMALLNLLLVTFTENRSYQYNLASLKTQTFIFFGLFIINVDWIVQSLRTGNFEFFINEQRISFLIVPLIFYIGRKHLPKIKNHVLDALVVGVILYLIYVYGFLIHFYSFETNRAFQLNHFLKYDITTYLPGSYHHTYLGMYMTFAIAIVLEKFKYNPIGLWFAGFLTLNQFVLGSKLTFFISLLLVFYGISRLSGLKWKRKWVGLTALFVVILGISYAGTSGLLDTIDFSMGNRLKSWRCSLHIFSENKWLGTSKESAINFLAACINNKAVSTHNQLLAELLYYGLFGLWLIGYYIFLYKRSGHNFVFRILIGLVIFLGFFENVFSLQRGILFFAFFTSLCIYTDSSKKDEKTESRRF